MSLKPNPQAICSKCELVVCTKSPASYTGICSRCFKFITHIGYKEYYKQYVRIGPNSFQSMEEIVKGMLALVDKCLEKNEFSLASKLKTKTGQFRVSDKVKKANKDTKFYVKKQHGILLPFYNRK